MFVRKGSDGQFYVCRNAGGRYKPGKQLQWKDIFLIKWNGQGTNGYIPLGDLVLPKFLVGKRVRLKLVFEDDKQKKGDTK